MMSKILDYVPQPDSLTCQSAAIAKMTGDPDVYKIRQLLENLGDPGSPATMGEYLETRVQQYKYTDKGSLDIAIEYLKNGWKVISHGWFTPSGHVLSIVGWDFEAQEFKVDDPWFEFDFGGWTYAPHEKSGDDVRYSARGIWAACVRGESCDDAQFAYQERFRLGHREFLETNMWLHLIRN